MPERFMTLFATQANDVLRAILDQSVDCIKLINLQGELEYVNPNGLKALGVDNYDDLIGRKWVDMWPDGSRARVAQALDRAVRGQQDRFDGYCPDCKGEPRWWDVSIAPILDANGKLSHVLATSRNITGQVHDRVNERMLREEAERGAERSDSIAREMRHRLKNQLAVVSSVAKLLSRHSNDIPDLMDRFEGKLLALARAQDLLTAHRDRPISAAAAVAQVLEASGAGDNITVGHLPHARLGDDAIQQLALILGELQTNSLKYGALCHDSGSITLTGQLASGVLSLNWHEDCGQPVVPPGDDGSGFTLLVRLGSVPGQRAQVRWHSSGPSIDFHVRVL